MRSLFFFDRLPCHLARDAHAATLSHRGPIIAAGTHRSSRDPSRFQFGSCVTLLSPRRITPLFGADTRLRSPIVQNTPTRPSLS